MRSRRSHLWPGSVVKVKAKAIIKIEIVTEIIVYTDASISASVTANPLIGESTTRSLAYKFQSGVTARHTDIQEGMHIEPSPKFTHVHEGVLGAYSEDGVDIDLAVGAIKSDPVDLVSFVCKALNKTDVEVGVMIKSNPQELKCIASKVIADRYKEYVRKALAATMVTTNSASSGSIDVAPGIDHELAMELGLDVCEPVL